MKVFDPFKWIKQSRLNNDKAKVCLLGQAIGDTLGLGTESTSDDEVGGMCRFSPNISIESSNQLPVKLNK